MFENYDKENMFESIWNFPNNLKDAIVLGNGIDLKNDYSHINNIVIAGMGGSAIGGDIVSVLENSNIKIPYTVCRDYSIPGWVNSSSLVICSSYSGNTEETISAFHKSIEKGASICGITTGGTLLELLKENKKDFVKIPSGLQPRAAVAFSFIPIIKLIEKAGLIQSELDLWIERSIDDLEKKRIVYGSEGNENSIYHLALKIYKKIPIIYSDVSSMRINAPLFASLNSFGMGQEGVYFSSLLIALGDITNMPCCASPPKTFCHEKLVTSSFFHGISIAKTAEVASHSVNPILLGLIQSPFGTFTPDVVPFHVKITSFSKFTDSRSGNFP